MKEYYYEVLKQAYLDYSNLGQSIADGSISINEFDTLSRIDGRRLERIDKLPQSQDWKKQITNLMIFAKMNGKKIDERFKQYEIFTRLNKLDNIIQVIDEFRHKNHLNGDFTILDNITDSVLLIIFIFS